MLWDDWVKRTKGEGGGGRKISCLVRGKMGSREVDLQRSQFQGGDGMKRFLMITLMAITAVAVVAAPVWAAGGRKLSDRQLDNVHAGWGAVSDVSSADGDASANHSGEPFVAGAASSSAASVA